MTKLTSPLSAYLLGDKYFHTHGTELVESAIPDNKAYDISRGGSEEWFFCSKGAWIPAAEITVSYEEWQRNYRYPFNYLQHLYIKNPEMLANTALYRAPRIMYFDIECASDGTGKFPRPDTEPMIMFGYAIDNGDVQIHYIEDLKNRQIGIEDRELIQKFVDCVAQEDPDIIVGYNSYTFDLPYIMKRARKFGIDTYPLLRIPHDLPSRDRIRDMHLYMDDLRGNMGSRVHYDIYHVDVVRDQKLSGIKDRKMKTLGKYFLKGTGDDIIELEDGIQNTRAMMYSKEGIERLIAYQKSDVIVTRGLSNVYLPTAITAANELGLPLNQVINRSNGTLATIHVLKNILEERIIPDKPNEEMFKDMYDLIQDNKALKTSTTATAEEKEDAKDIKKSFQGAYVDIFKKGRFEKIWKLDFGSLYPSIIILFNLSFETVSFDSSRMKPLVGSRDESWRDFSWKRNPHDLLLYIPDTSYKKILEIDIDQAHRGVLPRVLAEGLAQRRDIRKRMKGLDKDSPEYIALDSQQNIRKVINNSIFGIMANAFTIGFLPVGFTITGLGRHLIRKAIELASDPALGICETSYRTKGIPWSDEWRRTSPVIEIDTDGILFDSEPDDVKMNHLLSEYIEREFLAGAKNDVLAMEKEEFGTGYIHGMKNYIVLQPGKTEPIIHGSAFKSSRAAPIIDRAVKGMIDHLLYGRRTAQEIIDESLDISKATLDDYRLKVKMSKHISAYKTRGETHTVDIDGVTAKVQEKGRKNESQMVVRIAEMYKGVYGFTPQKGDILEFVAAREVSTGLRTYVPFNKLRSTTIYSLDREYYLETIRDILEPIMPLKTGNDIIEPLMEL